MPRAPACPSAWRSDGPGCLPPARNASRRRSNSGATGRCSRCRIAAKIGRKPASGALTTCSSAPSASGRPCTSANATATASSAWPGTTVPRSAALNIDAGRRQRRLLADRNQADHEVLAQCDLAQEAEHVGLAGTEPAAEQQARQWLGMPGGGKPGLEPLLQRVLHAAEQQHGGAVRHAGAQCLERDAQGEHAGLDRAHAVTRTSGASGLSPPCGRTSSHTRICNAVYWPSERRGSSLRKASSASAATNRPGKCSASSISWRSTS